MYIWNMVFLLYLAEGGRYVSTNCSSEDFVSHIILYLAQFSNSKSQPWNTLYLHVHVQFLYMKKAVMVGPDMPAIPGQCCFEFVSSHQQGICITFLVLGDEHLHTLH